MSANDRETATQTLFRELRELCAMVTLASDLFDSAQCAEFADTVTEVLPDLLDEILLLRANLASAQAAGTRKHEQLIDAKAELAALKALPRAATEHDRLVFEALLEERARATAKHGDGSTRPDGTGSNEDRSAAIAARNACEKATRELRLTWRLVLLEEAFEACAESDPGRLRAELIQVASVAFRWIAAIDRREAEAGVTKAEIARAVVDGKMAKIVAAFEAGGGS